MHEIVVTVFIKLVCLINVANAVKLTHDEAHLIVLARTLRIFIKRAFYYPEGPFLQVNHGQLRLLKLELACIQMVFADPTIVVVCGDHDILLDSECGKLHGLHALRVSLACLNDHTYVHI